MHDRLSLEPSQIVALRPRVGGDALRPDAVATQKRRQGRRKLGGMSQRQGVVSTREHHIFSLR
jgi:hypothetical protein